MPNHAKGAVLACGAVITFMAIIPPAMFGGTSGTAWMFVEKFQTLITGLLAVGAAIVTINKMGEVDREQAKRHRELIELGMRGDRLKIQRATTPHRRLLSYAATQLEEIDLSIENFSNRPGNHRWHLLDRVAERYLERLRYTKRMLEKPQFVDAFPLMDGHTTFAIDVLRTSYERIERRLEKFLEQNERPDDMIYLEVEFGEIADELIEEMVELPMFIRRVVAKLDELEIKYEI